VCEKRERTDNSEQITGSRQRHSFGCAVFLLKEKKERISHTGHRDEEAKRTIPSGSLREKEERPESTGARAREGCRARGLTLRYGGDGS
jgi:hypothetical protein